MIKKVTLQNIYGIKNKNVLNFEVSTLKDSFMNFQNDIILDNNIKTMITPTMISKNASGKTSILKAIHFSSKINSLEDLTNFIFSGINNEIRNDKNNINYLLKRLKHRFFHKKYISKKDFKNFFVMMFDYFDFEIAEFIDSNKIDLDYLNQLITIFFQQLQNKFLDILHNTEECLNDQIKFNILHSLNKNEDIIIEIIHTDSTKKIIKIGKKIVFNSKSLDFDIYLSNLRFDIENSILFKKYFQFFKEIIKLLNKNNSLEKKIFNDSLSKIFKKEKDIKKDIFKTKMLFIDDNIIRNMIQRKENYFNRNHLPHSLINFHKNRSFKSKSVIIDNLVSKYSLEFISKTLKNIDKSISHLEEQKSKEISIKGIDGVIKNTNTLSFGTLKILHILDLIYECFQTEKSSLVMIDEIENGLNLSLIDFIVKIFKNQEFNKNRTQVIFTSHNPLIFEKSVVSYNNAFLFHQNEFKTVRSIFKSNDSRTEDYFSIFKAKNYFNEYFWKKKLSKDSKQDYSFTSTLSFDESEETLDELDEL